VSLLKLVAASRARAHRGRQRATNMDQANHVCVTYGIMDASIQIMDQAMDQADHVGVL